jgi:hypothetical protein
VTIAEGREEASEKMSNPEIAPCQVTACGDRTRAVDWTGYVDDHNWAELLSGLLSWSQS